MRYFVCTLLLLACALMCRGQQFEVERLSHEVTDLSASTYPRTDLNSRPCALLKVQIPLPDLMFEGNVMGSVENKAGEYWVYLSEGSKHIVVKHASCLPTRINFADHDITGLAAKQTYVLRLKSPAVTKAEVTFKVYPADAILTVDNVEYELTDGIARIPLACTEHTYLVVAPGYKAQSNIFKVGESSSDKIVIELDRKSTAAGSVAQTSDNRQQAPAQTPVSQQQIPVQTSDPTPVNTQGVSSIFQRIDTLQAQASVIRNLLDNMVLVEGGTFKMGSNDKKADSDEKPVHDETVSTFHIGRYEVTQKEWDAVMGSNPSIFKGDDLPVESVSWDDCQEFIKKLNDMTGKNFRLPTEAEWEYAARGGRLSRGYKYSGSNNIGEVAWFDGNSGDKTHAVGTKDPNELGLYDMSANVREWTADNYSSDYSKPRSSPSFVFRGGSYSRRASDCRASSRARNDCASRFSGLGLRLVY